MPEPDDERRFVGYRAARDDMADNPSAVLPFLSYAVGLVVAAALVVFAGAKWYLSLYTLDGAHLNGTNRPLRAAPVVTFFLVALLSAAGLLNGVHSRRWKWFILGFLTGMCLIGLLEGLCFFRP